MSNLKHVIVTTQYYDPEVFQINHLVSLLLSKNYRVSVVAPYPSYPTYRSHKSFTQKHTKNPRLKIYRFPVVPRTGSLLSTLLNSLNFSLVALIYTLYLALKFPSSYLLTPQYSPFTCILPTTLASTLLPRRSFIWIFDLWPQSLFLLGNYRISFVHTCLSRLISLSYNTFSHILVSSESFLDTHQLLGRSNVSVLSSWEPPSLKPRIHPSVPSHESTLTVASIGNIGRAHDINLIRLFLSLSPSNIQWTFVGEGQSMNELRKYCLEQDLRNVRFLGFIQKEDCLHHVRGADLSLVPFLDSAVSDTISYRFITSISVGTPVLSFGKTAVSKLTIENQCGLVYPGVSESSTSPPHANPQTLALNFLRSLLSDIDTIRSTYRESSFSLYCRKFSEENAYSSLSSIL